MPVALRLDDPDGTFSARPPRQRPAPVARQRVVRAQRRRLGARARAARRAAARVQARGRPRRRRHRVDLRPRQPEARARARSARSPCSSCRATSAPAWLEAEAVAGPLRRGRRSAAAGSAPRSPIRVWCPADADPGTPLRMLLANDGPEYDALSALTRFSAAMIAAGELPPFRVALLAPGDRDHWYSASAAYARVLAHDIVPALRDGVRHDRHARGDGREPRRTGDAARPTALPACARRAVPAVRQLLHAALRRARAALQPLRADHPLRARDPARRAVRDPVR